MKLVPRNFPRQNRRQGFTLIELLMAMSVGLIIAGTVVILLVQASAEQRRGYADMTVEENAYVLQSRIVGCLRSMSSNFGITTDVASFVTNSSGNTIGYRTIVGFKANGDGTYTTQRISFDPSSGSVNFTPNVSTAPGTQTLWMSSGQKTVLRQFYFNNSRNLDNSQDNSLINVSFTMDDNGFSRQTATNNPANIQRSFAVLMRCD